MNKAFTKSKELVLDHNWKIQPDGDNGVVLIFAEHREKETIKIVNGKKTKTGLYEPFWFEDKFYFPRIAQALKHYATATINESDCLLDIIANSKKVYDLIEKLDKEFKQF